MEKDSFGIKQKWYSIDYKNSSNHVILIVFVNYDTSRMFKIRDSFN